MTDASRILQHIEELARCSEQPDGLTRVYLSDQAGAANKLVEQWMREAGMSTRMDAIGNIVGRYEGERAGAPCLMLGSHLDTVRNAGKYDGMLGVVTPIECVRALHAVNRRLPHAIEIVGFADEEGVRFASTFLGSRAIAGTFDAAVLQSRDRDGVSMQDALRAFGLDPDAIPACAYGKEQVLAYAELHIEQGPVLEAESLPVGVVTAINGFTRKRVVLEGMAGHAGTVPMRLRRDALAGAAECVLAIERIGRTHPDLVATVGRLEPLPGAINVIPGEVRFTIDIRAPDDALRLQAVKGIEQAVRVAAQTRGLRVSIEEIQSNPVARCAPWLMQQMDAAVGVEGHRVFRLPSGAGHDAQAMITLTDVCMLFVRCKGGISHNPAESITVDDAQAGARVLLRFIEGFRPRAS